MKKSVVYDRAVGKDGTMWEIRQHGQRWSLMFRNSEGVWVRAHTSFDAKVLAQRMYAQIEVMK